MNPLDLLKTIYETFGTPYPRASLVTAMVLSAIIGASVWMFAGKLVRNDAAQQVAVPQVAPSRVTGPASTKGDKDPAITGDGNAVTYDSSSPKTGSAGHKE
jgi:hypothetical protein